MVDQKHGSLQILLDELQSYGARLVAVSKTHPVDRILEIYQSGHRIFGENRARELEEKYESLPKDIEWHMIGHLQTNKVKYIASFVQLIHSVDRYKLLREINKQAANNHRRIDFLLQFHIAEEDTKFGFNWQEAVAMLESGELKKLNNIRITGVMGMATFTSDKNKVRREFQALKGFFDQLKKKYFAGADHFKEISMGMSDDYRIALEEGSTLVRIGSLIFGPRK